MIYIYIYIYIYETILFVIMVFFSKTPCQISWKGCIELKWKHYNHINYKKKFGKATTYIILNYYILENKTEVILILQKTLKPKVTTSVTFNL